MGDGTQLRMLWEQVDPAQALTTRFGFADPTAAVGWLGDTLLDRWALPVDDCDRLVVSSGNLLAWLTVGGRRVIAKCSAVPALFPRLADTAALTRWLGEHGVPVAAPIAATDGRLRVELGDVSVGVLPVVDGDLLDVDVEVQVDEAGRMLATVHQAMAAYPGSIDGGRPGDGEQLVHNDFRSANVLHDGTRITAVLDLDEVRYRSRIADLAQATVLLATRYHDWGPTTPEVRDAFVAAYRDRSSLTVGQRTELRRDMTAVLERFGWT